MERVAVSGSHGFIGSHLLDRLGQQFEVERVGRNGYISGADYIFDLASYGNMAWQGNEYQEIYGANVMRLVEELRSVEDDKYKAFVVVSTSSVTLPYQTFYSESKRAIEGMASIYAREFKKPIVVARPYSITGIGEQKEHLIPKLIDSCLYGNEIPFVPDPVHDFLDVDDFVDGLWTIALNAEKNKGEIFPMGSGKQHTNLEVKEVVEAVTGRRANVKTVENMRSYDTKEWRADNTRMYTLGWQPKKTLEQTIEEMIRCEQNKKR